MIRHCESILRWGLAIYLIVLSGDAFFRFFEWGEPSFDGQVFLISLTDAEYVWPMVGGILLISGLLLFFRRFAGLALVIVTPFLVQIVMFHIWFDRTPKHCVSSACLIVLSATVALLNRASFRSLWKPQL